MAPGSTKGGSVEISASAAAVAEDFLKARLAALQPQAASAEGKKQPGGDLAEMEATMAQYLRGLDEQVARARLAAPFGVPGSQNQEKTSGGPLPAPVTPEQNAADPSGSVAESTVAPVSRRQSSDTHQVSNEQGSPSKTRERARFRLPRVKKGGELCFLANDGSTYVIKHGGGRYRIAKKGDPKIASISKASIEQRGQAEGWVLLKGGLGVASGVAMVEPGAPALSPDTVVVASTTEPTVDTVVESSPVSPSEQSTVQKSAIRIIPISGPGDAAVKLSVGSELTSNDGSSEDRLRDPGVVPVTAMNPTPESLPMQGGVAIGAVLALLDRGQTLNFRRANGGEVRVEKKSDQYYVYEENGSDFITLGVEGLKRVAEEEGWQTVEAPPSMILSDEAMSALEARIAKLRAAVTEARTAFITAEESQANSWKKLMQTFRTLTHRETDDRDLREFHSRYDQTVLALQEAELEKLKCSGKTFQELRPEMAALIREFQFDEAEQIYNERRQQRFEKTNQLLSEKLDARWQETIGSVEEGAGKGKKWKEYIRYIIGATADVGGSAVQGIESLGKVNNELTKKYGKYLLTATVTVGGAVALGAATGGVASVAIGALALKRLAAGAGLAVVAEAGLEQYATSRREKKREKVETDETGVLQKMEDAVETEEVRAIARGEELSGEIDLSAFEAFLKAEAAKARRGEGKRRMNTLFRKSVAIFAGAVLGSGVASHYVHEFFTHQADAAPTGSASPVSESGPSGTAADSAGATAPERPLEGTAVSSATGSGTIPDTSAAHASRVATDAGRPASAIESRGEVGPKTQALLAIHEVKRGENIWKLAEQAVKDIPEMEGRRSEHFAKLVELKLQAKLDASPELARAAGFVANADGKYSVHSIQAGAKLEIGKLISADEMATLVEEAKRGALIEVPTSHVPSVVHPSMDTPVGKGSGRGLTLDSKMGLKLPSGASVDLNPVRTETVVTLPTVTSVDGVVELRPEAELLRPDGSVMKYIESLSGEDQRKLFQNFKRVSDEIFQTDEVMHSEGYHRSFNPTSHSELVKTKLAVVLADHGALTSNPLTSYDRASNPLHWSQMESIAKLVKASGKTLGVELARARSGESIQEYVLRMVALAGSEGKKIPGFRMLN